MVADVIVIGGGYGGLTTAAILAHSGLKVEVLEATGHLGGRSTFDRKDGYLVDYGLHVNRYGSRGAAAAALGKIGHEIDFISLGQPRLFLEGQFLPMPTGVSTFLSSGFLSWANKLIIGHGVRRLIISNTDKLADVPLEKVIPGADREDVRGFYRVLSGMGLVAPYVERASAGEFVKFMRRAMRAKEKVAYPRGGTSQIIEALSKKIKESGEISLNSRVKALDIEKGRVTGVRVQESELEARAVVSAIPVQNVPELIGGALPDEFRKRCSSLVPTAGISIDLCLDDKISDIDGFIITADPVALGQFTSNVDPGTAPEGKQLATFVYLLPAEIMDDRKAVDAEEKRLMAMLNVMFPGILDRVEWQRVLRLKMVDGFEPRVGQTAKDRPAVKVPFLDNLFLACDCVGVEGMGGDVAFSSGVEAAKQVLSYLK